jgi:hypothetical protein
LTGGPSSQESLTAKVIGPGIVAEALPPGGNPAPSACELRQADGNRAVAVTIVEVRAERR